VLRGLNQKKGVDISSAPTVVAKRGQRAKVEVVREFPYPTEFEPPEIPQDVGADTRVFLNGVEITQAPSSFPVTPTTPTAFTVRNVGHTLEVEATVGPDNHTIELDVVPAFSAFEGLVNYGSPIQTYPNGPIPQILTENRIPQPVFRTNRVTGIRLPVWNGHTVVIAGFASEERTTVEDKTPIFGDLPFVGHLFRSKVGRVKQKAVVFMVKAEIIDPSGEIAGKAEDIAVKN